MLLEGAAAAFWSEVLFEAEAAFWSEDDVLGAALEAAAFWSPLGAAEGEAVPAALVEPALAAL